jgi:hypothetical protein
MVGGGPRRRPAGRSQVRSLAPAFGLPVDLDLELDRLEAAPAVARLLAAELGESEEWAERQVAAYREVAAGYIIDTL